MPNTIYIPRTIEAVIKRLNTQFPTILLTGPRQVGKTTCFKHADLQHRTYVTLDDPMMAALAKTEPKLFLERFQAPILIDEIQYAPELLPYIKIAIDTHRISGQYWLTGSQQFHLMKGVSESLAGRIGIINLLGLSQIEAQRQSKIDFPFSTDMQELLQKQNHLKKTSLDDIYKTIWRGSFPVLALNNHIDVTIFYNSYLQTYLQRDVRDLAKVGDESTFLRFLRATAARTAQLLNIADLARDADISPNTAKNWLSILQTSGIIYLLEPYHNNLTKRLVKTPKLYFLDTGLCCYLTQWSDHKTLEAGAMSGAMLETFVFTEILKSYWHNGLQAPLYYYRDKDKVEIDLLILKDQTLYPIEIKKTAKPDKQSYKHFQVLNKLNLAVGHGTVICFVDTVLPLTQNVTAVPIGIV